MSIRGPSSYKNNIHKFGAERETNRSSVQQNAIGKKCGKVCTGRAVLIMEQDETLFCEDIVIVPYSNNFTTTSTVFDEAWVAKSVVAMELLV